MNRRRSEWVRRFSATERLFHWAMALPYLALLATGSLLLAERRFALDWIAIEDLVFAHRVAGCALPIGLFLVFLGGDRRVLLENAAFAFRWGREDIEWLALAPVARFLEIALPPAAKFNAGQKLNLLAQIVLIPTFAATGAWMWLFHGALLPWYVHVGSFAIATPLVAGHLFLALVNPETRVGLPGVFTGRVDAEWARHHHPREYGVPIAPWVAEPISLVTARSEPPSDHDHEPRRPAKSKAPVG